MLIRHGQTQWTLEGRHTGRTDLPLTPLGEAQSRALAPEFAHHFTAVFCSPLLRARRTCELAGLGERVVIDPDLCEWDYGAYEGLTTAEIRSERAAWDLFDDGAPGGETAADVGRRADRAIARIRAIAGDVACVAHAHVLRVLAARWIGLDPAGGRHLVLAPASVSELGWERERPVICGWNRT
ncbi:MAG TPA: histidine phosphatase family protein [Acidimicrobiales bacterium]|nr:histidine phosphatase family protein [Acidimicrobiales bacterium]